MSFAISARAELLKTKRSASFWLSIAAAGIIPALFSTAFLLRPDGALKNLEKEPWTILFTWSWEALDIFIFPMYVILICTLIPQIEYKNNTWKQVFASPQSLGNIFFSKFLTIHLMIFFFYALFNFFVIAGGLLVNVFNNRFNFFDHSIDWQKLIRLNFKTYLSILGISAIQYWFSLRFKNFIAPVGIGLALLVISLIVRRFGWEHIYKLPFAHPLLTLETFRQPNRPLIENHEWNSVIYFVSFALLGFLDLKFKKEKG
jgi:hypothetical protein